MGVMDGWVDADMCMCVCVQYVCYSALLTHSHTHLLSLHVDATHHHMVAMSGDIRAAKWLLERGVTVTMTSINESDTSACTRQRSWGSEGEFCELSCD